MTISLSDDRYAEVTPEGVMLVSEGRKVDVELLESPLTWEDIEALAEARS